ncbi:hypothetical protein FHY55_01225 [Oceanicola sp. D3]|uniref:hypothetical protein n=1 Tax=Oceanicola sp. D3 TaxID=2587163 RepID=UPI001120E318|nr:hypothetical protein [Oceanicola sp. D3]QDC07947.1 hypothetical protein FHY55_01225 [Oceanicola sp. D3]
MFKTLLIAPLFALCLLTAPAAAASLTGAWNCQAVNGDRGIGRRVTFGDNGRFDSRMAYQIKLTHKGKKGLARLTASMEGSWSIKNGLLVERVTSVHHVDVTVQEGNRATKLKRSEAAESQRRALKKNPTWRYKIRSLSDSKMKLLYLSPRGGRNNVNISCRKL